MVPGIGPAQSSAVNRWYRETQVQDNRGLDWNISNSLRHGRFASHIFYTPNNSLQHYVPKGNLPNQSSPAEGSNQGLATPSCYQTWWTSRASRMYHLCWNRAFKRLWDWSSSHKSAPRGWTPRRRNPRLCLVRQARHQASRESTDVNPH